MCLLLRMHACAGSWCQAPGRARAMRMCWPWWQTAFWWPWAATTASTRLGMPGRWTPLTSPTSGVKLLKPVMRPLQGAVAVSHEHAVRPAWMQASRAGTLCSFRWMAASRMAHGRSELRLAYWASLLTGTILYHVHSNSYQQVSRLQIYVHENRCIPESQGVHSTAAALSAHCHTAFVRAGCCKSG